MKQFPFKMFAILIITAFSSNISLSAEGVNKPFHKTPIVKQQSTAEYSGTSAKNILSEEDNEKFKKMSGNNMIDTSPKQSPFIKSLFVMLKALFAVLVLIGSLFGGLVIYQWLKNNATKNQQKQLKPAQNEAKSPETISEAVASFVKHRIKK